jgi:hypothetical protein
MKQAQHHCFDIQARSSVHGVQRVCADMLHGNITLHEVHFDCLDIAVSSITVITVSFMSTSSN